MRGLFPLNSPAMTVTPPPSCTSIPPYEELEICVRLKLQAHPAMSIKDPFHEQRVSSSEEEEERRDVSSDPVNMQA